MWLADQSTVKSCPIRSSPVRSSYLWLWTVFRAAPSRERKLSLTKNWRARPESLWRHMLPSNQYLSPFPVKKSTFYTIVMSCSNKQQRRRKNRQSLFLQSPGLPLRDRCGRWVILSRGSCSIDAHFRAKSITYEGCGKPCPTWMSSQACCENYCAFWFYGHFCFFCRPLTTHSG